MSSEPRRSASDVLFAPFDKFCRFLGRYFSYFKPTELNYRLFDGDFTPPTSDRRENFIPVRLPVIVARLLAPYKSDANESRKRAEFIKLGSARFHYDVLELLDDLHESFAPFDPDSDALFEPEYGPAERAERRERFATRLKDALTASNYFEIPRSVVDRLLQIKLPGALPVVAKYDDFLEYRIFARGVVQEPTIVRPPHRAAGRSLTVRSEILSRVCVFARLKVRDKAVSKRAKLLRTRLLRKKSKAAAESSEDGYTEFLVVKLFKNISLEELKMVAPKIKMKFPVFDGIKIGGTFVAGTSTSIVKIIVAGALSFTAFLALTATFCFAMFKSFLGFIHRRTAYLQKYADRLYFHSLASNFSAVNMLITGAEEQEIKEFVLGYFSALSRGGWSTELEIDEAVERWLKEQFGLAVDFESSDALRKLRDKRLLEERPGVGADGAPLLDGAGNRIPQYRVLPLDAALRALDEDWDRFFEYNV